MKMKDRNAQLRTALGGLATPQRIKEAANIPATDTVNRSGRAAYSLPDELRLIALLNTSKITSQAYRSENEVMAELRDLIERIGMVNPYFVAQAIVYSRCLGEGMRSINHLAATIAAPFIAGRPWAKAFYGAFDKNAKMGGTIFRLDDMNEIKNVWSALNTKDANHMLSLPNAMKKGFASVLENADANLLAKYKSTVIDISNLVHPSIKKAKATVNINGKEMKVIDAIMKGYPVVADTHETANSEAGQLVAKAVKDGKLTKDEAEKVLADAKNDNWESLLNDGKLGMLAAFRNIRNIMKNPRKSVIDKWCKLITDTNKIRKSLINPMHIDLAYEIVMDEFANADYSPVVQKALLDAYEKSVPNLAVALPGKTCVIVDCSGSMGSYEVSIDNKRPVYSYYNSSYRETKTCAYKAGLIAATIVKATGGDVIKFGDYANYFNYTKNKNVFGIAKEIGTANFGCTRPEKAWELMTREHKMYDRVIFISDNENNGRVHTAYSYKDYITRVCSPYVYAIDLACYGTTPYKNTGKVNYYYGYGFAMFDDIAHLEFNPNAHIDKVRQIVIDPNYTPTPQDLGKSNN